MKVYLCVPCWCALPFQKGQEHLNIFNFIIYRHLQADGWKIVSAADDKTLKVE